MRPRCFAAALRSWKFYGVIPEIDIWRAATLMLKRYGERALEESASRADELASAGDDNGVAVWRRICMLSAILFTTYPPGLFYCLCLPHRKHRRLPGSRGGRHVSPYPRPFLLMVDIHYYQYVIERYARPHPLASLYFRVK